MCVYNSKKAKCLMITSCYIILAGHNQWVAPMFHFKFLLSTTSFFWIDPSAELFYELRRQLCEALLTTLTGDWDVEKFIWLAHLTVNVAS